MKATLWSLVAGGLCGASVARPAEISEFTWNPGSSGALWDSAANWSGPSGQFPDDNFDRAIFQTAGLSPVLDREVRGNIGEGLGQLIFQTAGWTLQNEPGGDYILYFDSTPLFGGNALYSRGSGLNRIQTRVEFSGPAQTLFTAPGNTLVLERGVTGTYGPIISSENPTAEDTGAVRLDAASTVSGAFYLRQGTLLVRHSQGLGTASSLNLGGDALVTDGAQARLLTDAAGVTISPAITVRALAGHEVNATLGGNQSSGASAFAGTITLHRDVRLTSANTDGQAVAFNQTITGTGGITKVGPGTVALNHANSYAGGTVVQAGTLRLGAAGALPTSTTVILADSARVRLDLNGWDQTVTSLSGGGSQGGQITLGTATLMVGSGDFRGTITGSGGLWKTGSGTLGLAGANTYTGPTLVLGGTLSYGGDHVLGSGPVTISGSDARLDLGGYSDAVGQVTLELGGRIIGSGTLSSSVGFVLREGTVAAPLGGTAGLQKTSTGTVTLEAANPFSGETRIVEGTLRMNHPQALQQSTVNLATADTGTLDLNGLDASLGGLSGGRDLAVPDGRTLTVGLNHASLTYEGRLTGKNLLLRKAGTGTWTLTADQPFTGRTEIQAGTLSLGGGGAAGWVSTPIHNEGTLVFHRADSRAFASPISGSGGLIKLGSGSLTLTADNDYTGLTSIRDGVLLVQGWHSGGGDYEVGGGISAVTPVLGGTGFLQGNVRVWPGADLAPGGSLGTFTIQGDVTLAGTLAIDLDGAGAGRSDLLQVEGTLDLSGGSLRWAVLSDLDDEAYVFASYGLLRGEPFKTLWNLPDGYYLDYHYQGLNQMALVVIPEPAPLHLFIGAALLWGILGRHGDRAARS